MRASHAKAIQLSPPAGITPLALLPTNSDVALGNARSLPRDVRTFMQGTVFAPLNPLAPVSINREMQTGRAEPRRWQYPVGVNLPTPPGAGKLIDFAMLRNIADLHGVARKCIELRKQEIADLDWEITVRAPDKKTASEMLGKNDVSMAIEQITDFFANPDPIEGRDWGTWMKAALEEVFVVDALSLYLHPTWGSDVMLPMEDRLAAIEIIDGTTIKPLVDQRGARPLPPNPAYQQFIYGYPRSEFEAVVDDLGQEEISDATLQGRGIITRFSTDQLMYKRYVERAWSPYGFPPTEQIILSLNLALKREAWHLAYFTESNVPAGLIEAPDTWTPTQLQAFQDGLDSLLSGDPGWQHKIKVIPAGKGFTQLKPPAHDIEFDEFMVRIVCLGFDVSPQEVGFPPRGQGLGGAGAAGTSITSAKRRSLEPMARWFKTAILDPIIRSQFGRKDLQFRWRGMEDEDDPELAKVEMDRIKNGMDTINAWRLSHDLEPFKIAEADKPFFLTASGPVFMEGSQQKADEQHALAQESGKVQNDLAGVKGDTMQNPPKDPNKQPAPGASTAKTAHAQLWRRKAMKALRAGKSADVSFDTDEISLEEQALIHAELGKATTPDHVWGAFAAYEKQGVREPNSHPTWLTAEGEKLERELSIWAAKQNADVEGDA